MLVDLASGSKAAVVTPGDYLVQKIPGYSEYLTESYYRAEGIRTLIENEACINANIFDQTGEWIELKNYRLRYNLATDQATYFDIRSSLASLSAYGDYIDSDFYLEGGKTVMVITSPVDPYPRSVHILNSDGSLNRTVVETPPVFIQVRVPDGGKYFMISYSHAGFDTYTVHNSGGDQLYTFSTEDFTDTGIYYDVKLSPNGKLIATQTLDNFPENFAVIDQSGTVLIPVAGVVGDYMEDVEAYGIQTIDSKEYFISVSEWERMVDDGEDGQVELWEQKLVVYNLADKVIVSSVILGEDSGLDDIVYIMPDLSGIVITTDILSGEDYISSMAVLDGDGGIEFLDSLIMTEPEKDIFSMKANLNNHWPSPNSGLIVMDDDGNTFYWEILGTDSAPDEDTIAGWPRNEWIRMHLLAYF